MIAAIISIGKCFTSIPMIPFETETVPFVTVFCTKTMFDKEISDSVKGINIGIAIGMGIEIEITWTRHPRCTLSIKCTEWNVSRCMMMNEMVIIVETLIVLKWLNVSGDIIDEEVAIIRVIALIINFEHKYQSVNTGTVIQRVRA